MKCHYYPKNNKLFSNQKKNKNLDKYKMIKKEIAQPKFWYTELKRKIAKIKLNLYLKNKVIVLTLLKPKKKNTKLKPTKLSLDTKDPLSFTEQSLDHSKDSSPFYVKTLQENGPSGYLLDRLSFYQSLNTNLTMLRN